MLQKIPISNKCISLPFYSRILKETMVSIKILKTQPFKIDKHKIKFHETLKTGVIATENSAFPSQE